MANTLSHRVSSSAKAGLLALWGPSYGESFPQELQNSSTSSAWSICFRISGLRGLMENLPEIYWNWNDSLISWTSWNDQLCVNNLRFQQSLEKKLLGSRQQIAARQPCSVSTPELLHHSKRRRKKRTTRECHHGQYLDGYGSYRVRTIQKICYFNGLVRLVRFGKDSENDCFSSHWRL